MHTRPMSTPSSSNTAICRLPVWAMDEVCVEIGTPVRLHARAAARRISSFDRASRPSSTLPTSVATFITPARMPVPSMPSSISRTNDPASWSTVTPFAMARGMSSQTPVHITMWRLASSATSLSSRMSRPRSIVVTSTIVPTPSAAASFSAAARSSTSASWSNRSGKVYDTPAELSRTCSCISVKPRSPASTGPRIVFTVAITTSGRSSWEAARSAPCKCSFGESAAQGASPTCCSDDGDGSRLRQLATGSRLRARCPVSGRLRAATTAVRGMTARTAKLGT